MKNILLDIWKEIKYRVEMLFYFFAMVGIILFIAVMLGSVILFFAVVVLGLWRLFIYLI